MISMVDIFAVAIPPRLLNLFVGLFSEVLTIENLPSSSTKSISDYGNFYLEIQGETLYIPSGCQFKDPGFKLIVKLQP